MTTPAHKLLGETLEDGWNITEKLAKVDGQSGGYFSVGYYVERGNEKAFLKALDFTKLLSSQSGADVVEQMKIGTDAFLYERDILEQCTTKGLSKVIKLHFSSQISIENFPVPYLIFELASSDVRKQSLLSDQIDLAWALKTIHSISVGLSQLHNNAISHQDLKPSNILILNNGDKKIGDFGRSVTKECKLPHASYAIAGAKSYAPPEGLYGYVHPDWNFRRLGCDFYQLGSMVVFLVTGMSLTSMIQDLLPEEFQAHRWRGTYHEVLPYLLTSFDNAISIIEGQIEHDIASELVGLVKELSHPDIDRRGNPKYTSSGRNPFNVNAYVSKFNRLAKVVEYNLWNLTK